MGNIKTQLHGANPGARLSYQPAFSENIIVPGCDVNGSSLPLWESEGCTYMESLL